MPLSLPARLRAGVTLGALLPLLACGSDTPLPSEADAPALIEAGESAARQPGLQHLVRMSARYHSTTQAEKAGYQSTHECVAHPALGGMGVHWVNFGLVDPVYDPLQPETLVYEPQPNGRMKLVAVEYIVVDAGQPRPSLAGQLFDIGGAPLPVPHWTLHVWLWRDNPSGMFAPFNPSVTCS